MHATPTGQRIAAIVRLAVTLLASALALTGMSIDPDAIYTIAMTAIALGMTVYSWWRNNNISEAAQVAQDYLDQIKKGTQDDD